MPDQAPRPGAPTDAASEQIRQVRRPRQAFAAPIYNTARPLGGFPPFLRARRPQTGRRPLVSHLGISTGGARRAALPPPPGGRAGRPRTRIIGKKWPCGQSGAAAAAV